MQKNVRALNEGTWLFDYRHLVSHRWREVQHICFFITIHYMKVLTGAHQNSFIVPQWRENRDYSQNIWHFGTKFSTSKTPVPDFPSY